MFVGVGAARVRDLFDQAKRLGCLVLGTSNKTEILLGLGLSLVSGTNTAMLYETLVELFPADGGGHSNLAYASLLTRDFDRADSA